MQVKAKISEARVNRVKPGMQVEIRLDALQGLKLKGIVKKDLFDKRQRTNDRGQLPTLKLVARRFV
jgi:multidrug resistance efflux pump